LFSVRGGHSRATDHRKTKKKTVAPQTSSGPPALLPAPGQGGTKRNYGVDFNRVAHLPGHHLGGANMGAGTGKKTFFAPAGPRDGVSGQKFSINPPGKGAPEDQKNRQGPGPTHHQPAGFGKIRKTPRGKAAGGFSPKTPPTTTPGPRKKVEKKRQRGISVFPRGGFRQGAEKGRGRGGGLCLGGPPPSENI